MSDTEEEKPFAAEVAKQGRAVCKKCKQKCLQNELRIAKLMANPFGAGKMKSWHHLDCMFEVFQKQRQTTKRIETPDDISGFDLLDKEYQDLILGKIKECDKLFYNKFGVKASPKKSPVKKVDNVVKVDANHRDFLFKGFRKLVADIANIDSYTEKIAVIQDMFKNGSDGSGFHGDVILWCRLLLPGVEKAVYNLQSKQLVKLFSRIFNVDQESMLEHLEQGDVSETIQEFFSKSKKIRPARNSGLLLVEVDEFLKELTGLTKEDEQINHFKNFIPKCTGNDLKVLIRLIKHDLRMNAGAKHVLEGVHPDAYQVFQSSRDIAYVINKCLKGVSKDKGSSVKAAIQIMTPVLPMLANACKSVEQAMKACPNGMYSEIKYDGERVQVHKQGSEFKYFSRNLKPVMPHKVSHFKEYIPKAFPHGKDIILDSEILMIDTVTGNPLPFGTLGKHKKAEFKDACACLFVFDCIYYNGESLTDKPIKKRKKILRENMTEIKNHIVFSEMEEIHKPEDLRSMIAKVLQAGLEGLVLKDIMGVYEPGKRHWLKVKKDYLFDGAMADSADLIVLGAWYGTGKKGGMMSVFLMGSYNTNTKKFCTVTKVHTGHDDKTLEKLQDELEMIKISCDPSKVPSWLVCSKAMTPDFVAKDPKKQPVWEITGAEFTQHDVHTAEGISIRFPRVTKIRDDKHWESATTVQELKELYKTSKESTDVSLLLKPSTSEEKSPKNKKQKTIIDYIEAENTQKPTKRKLSNNSPIKAKKPKESPEIFDKKMPAYFSGVRALLGSEIMEKHSKLIRYFIAYGGIVVPPEESNTATHVIHLYGIISKPSIKCPKTVKHVVIEWVSDTVDKETLPDDIRPYIVRWDPN